MKQFLRNGKSWYKINWVQVNRGTNGNEFFGPLVVYASFLGDHSFGGYEISLSTVAYPNGREELLIIKRNSRSGFDPITSLLLGYDNTNF